MTEIKQEPSAEVVTEQEDKGGIIINHYHSSRNAPLTVTKKETQPIVKPNFTNETQEDKEQYAIHEEFEEDFEVGDLDVIECATGHDIDFETQPVSIDEIGQLVAMITSNKAPRSEDLPKLKETYNKLEGTDIGGKIIEASGQQKSKIEQLLNSVDAKMAQIATPKNKNTTSPNLFDMGNFF